MPRTSVLTDARALRSVGAGTGKPTEVREVDEPGDSPKKKQDCSGAVQGSADDQQNDHTAQERRNAEQPGFRPPQARSTTRGQPLPGKFEREHRRQGRRRDAVGEMGPHLIRGVKEVEKARHDQHGAHDEHEPDADRGPPVPPHAYTLDRRSARVERDVGRRRSIVDERRRVASPCDARTGSDSVRGQTPASRLGLRDRPYPWLRSHTRRSP